eukprot:scaffold90639_cov66-Phaeocystis_antarctica.AAC.18
MHWGWIVISRVGPLAYLSANKCAPRVRSCCPVGGQYVHGSCPNVNKLDNNTTKKTRLHYEVPPRLPHA